MTTNTHHADPERLKSSAGKSNRIVRRYRRLISYAAAAPLVFLAAVTHHSWESDGVFDFTLSSIGFLLVMACTLGRLWASLYIAGRKTRELVTDGPYSVVRHPLYFFSLLGAMGLALVSGNIIIIGTIFVLYVLYYPFVFIGEERDLAKIYGSVWDDYAARTPRFIPKPSLFHAPERYTIVTRSVHSAFWDVIWFPIGFLLIEFLEAAQGFGWIPIWFTIP